MSKCHARADAFSRSAGACRVYDLCMSVGVYDNKRMIRQFVGAREPAQPHFDWP
jgi:hypothetical protein